MRDGAWPLTLSQKVLVSVTKVIPAPVMQRLVTLAAKRRKDNEE
jgi:hypothetical protein